MRLLGNQSVPLWRAPVRMFAVFLLLTCPSAMAVEYVAKTAITNVSITNPVASEVWLAGSPHTMTCTTSQDIDSCRETEETEWCDVEDSVTHYWTANSGTFKNNDNVGTSVIFICANSAGNSTVTVHADDNYTPTNNTALAEDAEKTDSETIGVIIPVVDQITYGGGNHEITGVTTPEYDRASSRNEPASYTKGDSTISASTKFWSSTALTESSSVDVCGYTTGIDLDNWGIGSGIFGTSWPSAAISNEGAIWCGTVNKLTYTTTWKYKCSIGSNTWISSTSQANHVIYVVWDAPKCDDEELYTKANLDTCTGWANGCSKVDTSDDTTNIPHQVQHGAKAWKIAYGYASTVPEDALNPFTWIPVKKGDCFTYADLMTKGCQILGVEASSERIWCKDTAGKTHWMYTSDRIPYWVAANGDADGDGTANQDEAGYPGVIDNVYVNGSDPNHNSAWRAANDPWNFHGASSVAGHWWEITFNSTPDHDTKENMCEWPNGPVISYPGPLYPTNNF